VDGGWFAVFLFCFFSLVTFFFLFPDIELGEGASPLFFGEVIVRGGSFFASFFSF